MLPFALFIISGAVIAALALAKRIEEKRKRTPFILRAVSQGDERIRELHQEALRQYALAKNKSAFFLKKQLPLKLKSLAHKLQAYLKERGEDYFGDVRNSRLLKRPDGISEFFKSISEVEKGGGEINDTLPEELQRDFHIETTAEKPVEVTETKIETVVTTEVEERPVHIVTAVEPAPEPKIVKPRKKRVYKPRAKKLAVVEVLD